MRYKSICLNNNIALALKFAQNKMRYKWEKDNYRNVTPLVKDAFNRHYEITSRGVEVTTKTARSKALEAQLRSFDVHVFIPDAVVERERVLERQLNDQRKKLARAKLKELRTLCLMADRHKVIGKWLNTVPYTEYDVAFQRYISFKYLNF